MPEAAVLLAAFMLDSLMGDPVYPWHPVRLMGKLISCVENWLFGIGCKGYVGGFLIMVAIAGVFSGAALCACLIADTWFPFGGNIISIFLVYSAIGLRDLCDHAALVRTALLVNDISAARQYVQRMVGRDADCLDAVGIARAAVESVAENFVDGFLSPVFWFVCGGFCAGLLGRSPLMGALTGVIVYRCVNTLDAMVGYTNDRYGKFGFISAKADDVLNFLPARLSVGMIAAAAFFFGFDAKKGIAVALRDRLKHASPNSGHPESAIAGVLNIRLGGPTVYPYGRIDKPWLGDDDVGITPEHINDACRIIFGAAGIALVAALVLTAIF